MIKQFNSMTRALVNGLSPQIVFPGSKLTIRGENLGEDIDDIISNSLIHILIIFRLNIFLDN